MKQVSRNWEKKGNHDVGLVLLENRGVYSIRKETESRKIPDERLGPYDSLLDYVVTKVFRKGPGV